MTLPDAMLIGLLGGIALFGLIVVIFGITDVLDKPEWEPGATCMVCRKNPCVGCQ